MSPECRRNDEEGSIMNRRALFAVATLWTVFFLSGSATAQDARGPAGLPIYIKSPGDKPPFEGIEAVLVGPNRTTNDILASIPPSDSVIVISGNVDTKGRNYYSAYPKFRAGSLYGALKACRKEYLMRPQYKVREGDGYALIVVVKDTATDPDCWNQFRNLDTVDLSCDEVMVQTAETDEPVAWVNPDSSYANSYDLRRFRLGSITPK